MESYDYKLNRGIQPAFDAVPGSNRVRVFGVDYVVLRGMQGGQFYLTRHGWPLASSLLPRFWYTDGRFRETGTRLLGSTGTVYRVPLAHQANPRFSVVIKFNRFAQDAPAFYTMGAEYAGIAADERVRGARFLSPFEEFSLLEQLRSSHHTTGQRRLLTQRPFGIYCPPTHYPEWRLGRSKNLYWAYDQALSIDQRNVAAENRVSHDWNRVYITLFQWLNGIDIEQAADQNLLKDTSMEALSRDCHRELGEHGFAVWDSKPRHIILPKPRRGQRPYPVQFRGRPLWALVDYELLFRPDHPKPVFPALDPVQLAPTG